MRVVGSLLLFGLKRTVYLYRELPAAFDLHVDHHQMEGDLHMALETRKPTLQLCAPPLLMNAIKLAAAREMTSISEYVRRSLIDRLRSDGIDPAAAAITRSVFSPAARPLAARLSAGF